MLQFKIIILNDCEVGNSKNLQNATKIVRAVCKIFVQLCIQVSDWTGATYQDRRYTSMSQLYIHYFRDKSFNWPSGRQNN